MGQEALMKLAATALPALCTSRVLARPSAALCKLLCRLAPLLPLRSDAREEEQLRLASPGSSWALWTSTCLTMRRLSSSMPTLYACTRCTQFVTTRAGASGSSRMKMVTALGRLEMAAQQSHTTWALVLPVTSPKLRRNDGSVFVSSSSKGMSTTAVSASHSSAGHSSSSWPRWKSCSTLSKSQGKACGWRRSRHFAAMKSSANMAINTQSSTAGAETNQRWLCTTARMPSNEKTACTLLHLITSVTSCATACTWSRRAAKIVRCVVTHVSSSSGEPGARETP
mmetsp:Transcript_35461/g.82355  ORF Transcript_35461/g.82355 Transcript_35461/m.82355 type:complete len:283 (-) Transcript_35461:221-1069(-)